MGPYHENKNNMETIQIKLIIYYVFSYGDILDNASIRDLATLFGEQTVTAGKSICQTG